MRRVVELTKNGLGCLLGDANRTAESVLVISPHLDDAVLSVGATIACISRMGATVEVLTLFAAEPKGRLSGPAQHFHDLCRHPHDGSAILARREEDRRALEILGVRVAHSDFLDAVYREQYDGQWLCQHNEAMFSEELADESDLVLDLSDAIRSRYNVLKPDMIWTCSAFGGHVDHRHTLRAVRAVAQDSGTPLWVWEDLPYAVGRSPIPPVPALPEKCVYSDYASWLSKWSAIAAYTSQVHMLWRKSDWTTLLTRHAEKRGGHAAAEVFWDVSSMVPQSSRRAARG